MRSYVVAKAQRGRPVAGKDAEGLPVAVSKSYPQLTLRVPPATKALIDSLAVIRQRSQSQVVEEAIDVFVGTLPVGARRAAEELKAAKLATAKKRGG